MMQKSNQFKGQQKKKTVALNRHGKSFQNRKGILFTFLFFGKSLTISVSYLLLVLLTGRRYMEPSKTTKELDTDRVCFYVPELI